MSLPLLLYNYLYPFSSLSLSPHSYVPLSLFLSPSTFLSPRVGGHQPHQWQMVFNGSNSLQHPHYRANGPRSSNATRVYSAAKELAGAYYSFQRLLASFFFFLKRSVSETDCLHSTFSLSRPRPLYLEFQLSFAKVKPLGVGKFPVIKQPGNGVPWWETGLQ